MQLEKKTISDNTKDQYTWSAGRLKYTKFLRTKYSQYLNVKHLGVRRQKTATCARVNLPIDIYCYLNDELLRK